MSKVIYKYEVTAVHGNAVEIPALAKIMLAGLQAHGPAHQKYIWCEIDSADQYKRRVRVHFINTGDPIPADVKLNYFCSYISPDWGAYVAHVFIEELGRSSDSQGQENEIKLSTSLDRVVRYMVNNPTATIWDHYLDHVLIDGDKLICRIANIDIIQLCSYKILEAELERKNQSYKLNSKAAYFNARS